MIVEKSFSEALIENKLVNVSPPKIVIKSNPSFEQPLEFDAEFEIMPNFKKNSCEIFETHPQQFKK